MSPVATPVRWLCCHLGAREHYAVPRALYRRGKLGFMVTDAWTRPGSPFVHLPGRWSRRLAERYHTELETADVRDLTLSLLKVEVEWRMQRLSGWDLAMARNEWFQRGAAEVLAAHRAAASEKVVVFAHSYSARGIFQIAKARGWTTVLGQIDPGEEHFAIVNRLSAYAPQYGPAPSAPPILYFERWREECALADHIVVNSQWSREAVIRAGIPADRLHVVPLVYEPATEGPGAARSYPAQFSAERPLRLLFVGSASVVKGVPALIEAMKLLAGLPVVLRLVGETGMTVPDDFRAHHAIEWVGPVPRSEITHYYETSDVLVFPSHSDGFGMAQIEAQGHGLPIIASRHCGSVVRDGENGLLLPEVTPHAIAAAVRALVAEPARLGRFSAQARPAAGTGLVNLGAELMRLVTPRP